MLDSEIVEVIQHLLTQLDDEHQAVKTNIQTNANLLTVMVDCTAANLHEITDQIQTRLGQLKNKLPPA